MAETSPNSVTQVASAADCGLSNFSADLLQQINVQRARGASCGTRGTFPAVPLLAWQAAVATAAAGHARDMAGHNLLSHTGSDGRLFDQRLTDAGYVWRVAAENIASGYPSVSAVVAGWMASDGHCANLMNAHVQNLGGACAVSTDGGRYWVVDLGRP